MSEPQRIESPANTRIKGWRQLHRRRERDATGQMIIEGARELSRALAASIEVEVVATRSGPPAAATELAAAAVERGAEHVELSDPAMERLSRRQNPPAVMGIARTPAWRLNDLTVVSPSLVLVADRIEKPGNLGAMIRSADGAGADAVIASDPATDLANPNVIRASQGAIFGLAMASGSAAEVAGWLEQRSLSIVVATDEAPTPLWETDLNNPIAVVIGSEDRGVSAPWRDHPAVSIPMSGASDSLNASVAAAVILFEARRQRTSPQR